MNTKMVWTMQQSSGSSNTSKLLEIRQVLFFTLRKRQIESNWSPSDCTRHAIFYQQTTVACFANSKEEQLPILPGVTEFSVQKVSWISWSSIAATQNLTGTNRKKLYIEFFTWTYMKKTNLVKFLCSIL